MPADTDHRPARRRTPRRGPSGRLRDALIALTAGYATIVRHAEKPWASVTFEGARHTLELRFTGAEAIPAAERFIEELAEHEFAIPGHLVAEARIVEVDQRMIPNPCLTSVCELLLLKDA